VFWIVTEGNRVFDRHDGYGRLKSYDDFAKEGVTFTDAIASATSTLMSTSSMFTGRFSYELYYAHSAMKDFKHDSYLTALEKKGYSVHGTFFCKEGHTFYNKALNIRDKKDEHKSGNAVVWDSFMGIMEKQFNNNGPNFVYLHLGPYSDQEDYLKKVRQYLIDKGLYEESFVIYSSDHGYTDYGDTHAVGWLKHPRNHSFYVSEDCYAANLLMCLPNGENSGKKIDAQVGLFDVFETVFDYMGLKYSALNKKAVSLKKLIDKTDEGTLRSMNDRKIRIDNRYIAQNQRMTIIRNKNYELMIAGTKYTLFKRVKNTDWEKRLVKVSIAKNKLIFKDFLRFYKKTNTEAKKTTLSVLAEDFKGTALEKVITPMKNKHIAVFNYSSSHVLKFLIKLMKKENVVDVVDKRTLKRNYKKYDYVFALSNNKFNYSLNSIVKFCNTKNIKLLMYNLSMCEVSYKKHNLITYPYTSDTMAYIGKNPIESALIYLVYFLLQSIDLYHLKTNKENYLPVTSF
jgi:hypothetical protein